MSASAAMGFAEGVNGHDAAQRAVQQALNALSSARPVLALTVLSHKVDANQALAGMNSLLGNTPVWGFSSSHVMAGGSAERTLSAVVLFAGSDLRAQVSWIPLNAETKPRIKLELGSDTRAALVAGDALGEGIPSVNAELQNRGAAAAGCLSSGDIQLGRTFQIGAGHTGAGTAIASLGGKFFISTAAGHGWRRTGASFTITKSQGSRILALDGKAPIDVYCRLFGFSAEKWRLPPLSDVLRLYPLEIEVDGKAVMRAPIRFEPDGSLLVNGNAAEGKLAHLMIGDPNMSLKVAQEAARAAKGAARGKPLCALVLADTAWDVLFESQPGELTRSLAEVLGSIPFLYASTQGQIFSESASIMLENQNILVVVISAEDGKN